MAKKKHKTRTGALTNDTGAAERKKEKTVKMKALDYYSTKQFLSFKLVKGKHTLDLGSANMKGKEVSVFLTIESQEEKATWLCDLKANCFNYEASRTIPNNTETSWHYVPSNTASETTLKLTIHTTSNNKDAVGVAKLTIL
jgi:hypothetical protein